MTVLDAPADLWVYTDTSIQVEQFLKGTAQSNTVQVRTQGGSVPDAIMIDEEGAELREGQHVLLFLTQQYTIDGDIGTEHYWVAGAHQGAFEVVDGEAIRYGERFPLAELLAVITQPDTSAPEFESTGSLAFFPKTVEELVQDTDTIVIGTVKSLVERVTFASYDENGEMKRADELNLPADADVSMFDYELQIERVLKPHEGVASNQSIILRMPMDGKAGVDYSTWDYPPSVPGERRLYFLGLNPDGKTYGLTYGPASRIIIDGATVQRTGGQRSAIPGAVPGKETSSPAAFIADVERMVEQQRAE